jgi:hypothetical protein
VFPATIQGQSVLPVLDVWPSPATELEQLEELRLLHRVSSQGKLALGRCC